MASVAQPPGLSALLAWPTDHLTAAADHWEDVGERTYGVAHGVWSEALTVDWSRQAAEALRTDTHADLMTTSAVVDRLQSAAAVARGGASDLEAARSHIRYAVEDARTAGYEVGEDLSVTDRMTGGSLAQQVARQAAAQTFAGNIGERAAQLVGLDARVAGRVSAAVAGIGTTFQTTGGQVQAVDNRTFKRGPDQPHPEPKGPSSADIRKVIEQLPRGSRDAYREVKSPEDLDRLKKWITEHGTDMESRYPAPDMGRWKRLPDGSEIGERHAADSTGRDALDIDIKKADGATEHWKVHINPKTGGVPEFPAIEPAPVEPLPAEGFEGGGPSGMPFGPKLLHPPGTIDHGIPIIGEDDPGEDERDFKH